MFKGIFSGIKVWIDKIDRKKYCMIAKQYLKKDSVGKRRNKKTFVMTAAVRRHVQAGA